MNATTTRTRDSSRHDRKRPGLARAGWLVAAVVAGAGALLFVARSGLRSSWNGTSARAAPSAVGVDSVVRAKSVPLRSLAAASVRDPRADLPNLKGEVHEVTLKNGIMAELSTKNAVYPASSPIDARLKLLDARGEPLVGRGDLEVEIVDAQADADITREPRSVRGAFAESADEPGTYQLLVEVPKSFRRAAILAHVSETGNPMEPGEVKFIQANVDHSSTARLGPLGEGRLFERGASVDVSVIADQGGHATVRAELRDGDSASFGVVVANADIKPGPNRLTLTFERRLPREPTLVLADLTLFVDGEVADVKNDPIAVRFR